MGYFSMFMSIAMVVGPALGLYLWILLSICVIAALSLLFTMGIRMPKKGAEHISAGSESRAD